MKFDLIVIGSGPGGYVAAIRAILFHTSARVARVKTRDGGPRVTVANAGAVEEIAAGVEDDVDNLRLENLGVRCERGCIAL